MPKIAPLIVSELPSEVWESRSAEELLHRLHHAEDPGSSVLRSSMSSSQRSSSEGALRPLGPPMSSVSRPREVKNMAAQLEREASTEARRLLHGAYRHALEAICSVPAYQPPPLTGQQAQPLLRFDRPPLRTVLGPLPFSKKFVPKKTHHCVETTYREMEDSPALLGTTTMGPLTQSDWVRKGKFGTLREWGRNGMAGPFTIGQVYAEVQANVSHKKVRDPRMSSSHCGPSSSHGGTRKLRKLPLPSNLSRSTSAGSTMRTTASWDTMRNTMPVLTM